MDSVIVLLVEPESTSRAHLEHVLARETDMLLISRPDFLTERYDFGETLRCDVLLLDADRTPVTDRRTWARIHVLLPDVRIVATTTGHNEAILEAV